MKVAVIGAGKMGLPLACQFASRGAEVVAVDVNPQIVASINAGVCPIDEPGLPDLLTSAVAHGRLRATTAIQPAVADSEVIVVIVPVLLTETKEADLSVIETVTECIAEEIRPGTLVCYETTLPVGGTRRLAHTLERSGMTAGVEFDVAFSPERVKSQMVLERLTENPKVVGGVTPEAAERAAAFYAEYVGASVINVGTLEAAEMVKLAGMLYRDVNIALSNELARYAEAVGVDLPSVIAAANTDGEGALLMPGIGVGGHCTPVYPHFLIADSRARDIPIRLAEESRRVNDEQPSRVVDRLATVFDSLAGKRVLVLGLSFRPQVREHICSPVFALAEALRQHGAFVQVHDPLYTPDETRDFGFEPGSPAADEVPDALILNTAHAAYKELNFRDLAHRGLRAVVDGRDLWDPETIRDAGLDYLGVGRPDPASAGKHVTRIPITRPMLADTEAQAAADAVRSGWVVQGPQVAALEEEFAAYVGASYACAVSSGTAALHLALLAAGVGLGDEVITVSHSFIATANAIRYCGATPIFVDIEPDTYNIDSRQLELAITPRTRAILCVHQMGMPCDLRSIVPLARRHGLVVIEDAACAIGSEILWEGKWEAIGRPHGDIACFSFHPRKMLTTGDGGMLTTSNRSWDERLRLLREHGMSASSGARHNAREVSFESYPIVGYNYRLTDIQAAIGREQLKRLPDVLTRRRYQAERYDDLLAHIPGLDLPYQPPWARSNWQSYCVRLPGWCDQRQVMQVMLDQGVATRRGIMCAHREPAYRDGAWACGACGNRTNTCSHLRESELAQDSAIVLPTFHQMTDVDQDVVVGALEEACSLEHSIRQYVDTAAAG